jgi:phospholipid/cholesterol/gamma-HCH transport system substrate-binding protein
MYNSMNSSLQSISKLMDDIQAHPKKYINVTVFGKKGN